MVSNSMRRKNRHPWRYFLGLSVLGLLIIASASHAHGTLPAASHAAPSDLGSPAR